MTVGDAWPIIQSAQVKTGESVIFGALIDDFGVHLHLLFAFASKVAAKFNMWSDSLSPLPPTLPPSLSPSLSLSEHHYSPSIPSAAHILSDSLWDTDASGSTLTPQAAAYFFPPKIKIININISISVHIFSVIPVVSPEWDQCI